MANVVRDEQVIREVVEAANSNVRDQQIIRESVQSANANVRDEQVLREVVLSGNAAARSLQVFREVIFLPAVNVSVSVTGTTATASKGSPAVSGDANVSPSGSHVTATAGPLPVDQSVAVTGQQATASVGSATVTIRNVVDRPSIQFHPLVKPLDFYSRPLTQAGKQSASFTTFLTSAGASRAFSMPLGARNQPIAGKVFAFTMGGTITPGASGGSIVITPLYGATANGTNLGQSAPQRYAASTLAIPWRLRGEIIFQSVDLNPGLAPVICTGVFAMDGSVITFGSAHSIQVDVSATKAVASGALNFAATFAPATRNAGAPVVTTKYAFLRS